MLRRIAPAAPALLLVMMGCAGPAKLAEKSEQMLAGGQNGRAWELAIRALDKDPGNTRARSAAAAAGNAMARDWEQRIHVLAQSDSMAAAEQVLELNGFRVNAVRYAAISIRVYGPMPLKKYAVRPAPMRAPSDAPMPTSGNSRFPRSFV